MSSARSLPRGRQQECEQQVDAVVLQCVRGDSLQEQGNNVFCSVGVSTVCKTSSVCGHEDINVSAFSKCECEHSLQDKFCTGA